MRRSRTNRVFTAIWPFQQSYEEQLRLEFDVDRTAMKAVMCFLCCVNQLRWYRQQTIPKRNHCTVN